jgi:hypothetical protein
MAAETEGTTAQKLLNQYRPTLEPGQIFQHYKGGLYVVVALSIKEDTLEPMITYRSNKKRTYWTRTIANFLEMIDVPVESSDLEIRQQPRFRPIFD